MPPKKQTSGEDGENGETGGIEFTASEIKILNAIFLNSSADSKINPDWEAVRIKLESNSVEACKKRLSQISLKYGWFKAENPNPATPAPKKAARASSSKKKKAAELAGDGDADMNGTEETPVKKRKATPKKAAVEAAASEQNDELMEKTTQPHIEDATI